MVSVIVLLRVNNAKKRLSKYLSKEDRKKLIVLMFKKVISAVKDFDIYVLSPQKIEGEFIWIKDHWMDINLGLERARELIFDDILILPSDLPLIERRDVEEILKFRGDILIVPSGDGGTSGLFLKKGIEFKTYFDNNSFENHLLEAKKRGLNFKVFKSKNFRDLDNVEDLKWVLEKKGEVSEFLRSCLKVEISKQKML